MQNFIFVLLFLANTSTDTLPQTASGWHSFSSQKPLPSYTRIKPGMKNALMDVLMNEKDFLASLDESLMTRREREQQIVAFQSDKKALYETNFADNEPLIFDNDNPEGITYLTYSCCGGTKMCIINIKEVEAFLE